MAQSAVSLTSDGDASKRCSKSTEESAVFLVYVHQINLMNIIYSSKLISCFMFSEQEVAGGVPAICLLCGNLIKSNLGNLHSCF